MAEFYSARGKPNPAASVDYFCTAAYNDSQNRHQDICKCIHGVPLPKDFEIILLADAGSRFRDSIVRWSYFIGQFGSAVKVYSVV